MAVTELNIMEMKLLWVVGALERLSSFGFLDKDVPFQVTSKAIDAFISIDEYRHEIFTDEDEIGEIFNAIIGDDDVTCTDDHIQPIVDLILEYKNNRTEMVKYALSR
jgi:hypothetical protein